MIRSFLSMLIVCLSVPARASALHQSFDLQVPKAPTAVTIDGQRQLVYELHVTNYAGVGMLPSKLDVLDADAPEKPLGSWAGPALLARMAIAGTDKSPDAQGLAAGVQAVVYGGGTTCRCPRAASADSPAGVRNHHFASARTGRGGGRRGYGRSACTGEPCAASARRAVGRDL
jgi:hypothetical protein